jgi:hypothetical protein
MELGNSLPRMSAAASPSRFGRYAHVARTQPGGAATERPDLSGSHDKQPQQLLRQNGGYSRAQC